MLADSLLTTSNGVRSTVTKFRKEFIQKTFEEILLNATKEYGIEVFQMAVMPDHVHFIVGLHPSMNPSKATNLLKGRTSYEMRRFPGFGKLYRKRRLWSPGKFYRTTGDVDLETTTEYVRSNDPNQKLLSDYNIKHSGSLGL